MTSAVTPQDLLFLHLDDEFSKVCWIPRSLRTQCLMRFGGDVLASGPLDADKAAGTFKFSIVSEKVSLRVDYRFFSTVKELLAVPPEDHRRAVILLDLMGPGQGRQDHVGIPAFDALADMGIPPDRIYFLTGFVNEALQDLESRVLDKSHLLGKPIDPEIIVPILLKGAGVEIEGLMHA